MLFHGPGKLETHSYYLFDNSDLHNTQNECISLKQNAVSAFMFTTCILCFKDDGFLWLGIVNDVDKSAVTVRLPHDEKINHNKRWVKYLGIIQCYYNSFTIETIP